LFMALAGTVFASWEFVSSYASNTLYGGIYGQPWSPYDGVLYGHAYNVSGGRETVPLGNYVRWNYDALNYIRNNGKKVAITFHSFRNGGGCSSFEVMDYAGTNLPAPQINKYWRPPCWPGTFRYTEVRIRSNDANQISAGTVYWGQGFYRDDNTTGHRQEITVDTYYGGQENYHQKYCINAGVAWASSCP
jgi:hypothetical protein